MGDSLLGSFVGLILGLILLFVGPIYDAYSTSDKMVDTMVNSSISNFQKEVRKDGYVDYETYYDFLSNLNRTGRVYKVEFTHTNKLVYPNPTNPLDYEIHKFEYGQDYILKSIKDNGKYYMNYGDDFKVLVKESEIAPSRKLISMLSGSGDKHLMFSSGGMVENEVMN